MIDRTNVLECWRRDADRMNARIEELEAALQAIANPDNCLMLSDMEEIARNALDKDTRK